MKLEIRRKRTEDNDEDVDADEDDEPENLDKAVWFGTRIPPDLAAMSEMTTRLLARKGRNHRGGLLPNLPDEILIAQFPA